MSPSSAECSKLHLTGILTAPLASPDSHLLVSTKSFLFDLPVGSDSWSELQLPSQFVIDHFVEFDGQFIVSNSYGRSYSLQLAPQHGLQEIKTKPVGGRPVVGRLVVCGDMLLILSFGEFHRLDMSTEPATWVAVEKLGERALFMGAEVKSTPLSCMSPELWGGRSNIVYCARTSRPWYLYRLCGVPDRMQGRTRNIEPAGGGSTPVQSSVWPLWLYPSMFYSDGQ